MREQVGKTICLEKNRRGFFRLIVSDEGGGSRLSIHGGALPTTRFRIGGDHEN